MTVLNWPWLRAGYWRRSLAFAVDSLVCAVPLSILASVLFHATAGEWQLADTGLNWSQCRTLTSIPSGLTPPPLNPDSAVLCQVSSIGGQIGQVLTLSHTARTANTVTTAGQSYAVDQAGRAGAHDLSGMSLVILAIYLVLLEYRSGATVGKRLFGLRVVSIYDVRGVGLSLAKVLLRYAVLTGVYVPTAALLFYDLAHLKSFDGTSEFPVGVFALNSIVWIAWSLWNVIRIVRRRSSVYDHIASTEVVQTRRLREELATSV